MCSRIFFFSLLLLALLSLCTCEDRTSNDVAAATDSVGLLNDVMTKIKEGLSIDHPHFQLTSDRPPLADNSKQLFSFVNSVPGRGGMSYLSEYRSLVDCVAPSQSDDIEAKLGDNYAALKECMEKDQPCVACARAVKPSFARIVKDWCTTLSSDTLTRAADALSNPDHYWNNDMSSGIPKYLESIQFIRSTLAGGASGTIRFNSATDASYHSQMNTHSESSGGILWWGSKTTVDTSKTCDKLSSSRFMMNIAVDHQVTIAINPSNIYDWGIIAKMRSVPEQNYNVWKKDSGCNWERFFGAQGTLNRRISHLIVMDGMSYDLTTYASFSSHDKEVITTHSSGGFWPFEWSHTDTKTTEVSVTADGGLRLSQKRSVGDPFLFGMIVQDDGVKPAAMSTGNRFTTNLRGQQSTIIQAQYNKLHQLVGPVMSPSLHRPSCGLTLLSCLNYFNSFKYSSFNDPFHTFASIYSNYDDWNTWLNEFGSQPLCTCAACMPPALIRRAEQKFQCGAYDVKISTRGLSIEECLDLEYQAILGASYSSHLLFACRSAINEYHQQQLALIKYNPAYSVLSDSEPKPAAKTRRVPLVAAQGDGAPVAGLDDDDDSGGEMETDPDTSMDRDWNAIFDFYQVELTDVPTTQSVPVPVVSQYPKMSLETAGNLAKMRKLVRRPSRSDKLQVRGFTYSLDSYGRVTAAVGEVSLKTRSNIGSFAVQICDVMWNPTAAGNAIYKSSAIDTKRPRVEWQAGHMIASSLGGDDKDPINFFPQIATSNAQGSQWWRIELTAGSIAAAFTELAKLTKIKELKSCAVTVNPTFTYSIQPNSASNKQRRNAWIPSGGAYEVTVTSACWNAVKSGVTLDKFAKDFDANSQSQGGKRSLAVQWTNAPDVDDGPPPTKKKKI